MTLSGYFIIHDKMRFLASTSWIRAFECQK